LLALKPQFSDDVCQSWGFFVFSKAKFSTKMTNEYEGAMNCVAVRKRVLGWGLCALLCASGLGCGGEKIPPLFSVTGKITYNGKPVPGATIMFFPEAKPASKAKKGEDNQPMPRRLKGSTDDDGNYELAFGEDHVGAPAGKYKVGISAIEFEPGDDEDEARPNKVPNNYGNPETSGFTAVVKEDGDNVFNFTLVD
jgi:hypothetical protein